MIGSLFVFACRKFCITEHPHFPLQTTTRKLLHFAKTFLHIWNLKKTLAMVHKLFLSPKINGTVLSSGINRLNSLIPTASTKEDTILFLKTSYRQWNRRLFASFSGWGFRPVKCRPNQFVGFSRKEYEKKKSPTVKSHCAKTSRADHSKRSIFKLGVVCWCAGEDNWIHTGVAVGMHQQSTVEC